MFNLPRMNRNIGGRRNTVHFLFFLTRFHFLTAKTVLISFHNLASRVRAIVCGENVLLYLFLYLHEAGQVTYLLKKQENIPPENGYKFRNGNDLFLLSACNTQRFLHANQTASERQSYVRTGS